MFLFRLTLSTFKVRKMRMLLTLAAIALSVSLVVAVTSGYKSLQASALTFLNRYMGAFDAVISPSNDLQGFVPEKLVKDVAADPAVRLAIGRLESSRTLERAPGAAAPQKNPDRVPSGAIPADKIGVNLLGVRRPDDTTTDALELTDGRWFDTSSGNVAVVDQVAAEKLGVKTGDSIKLPGIHPVSVKIIGIVHKPEFFADRWATVYLPIETLQHLAEEDRPPLVSPNQRFPPRRAQTSTLSNSAGPTASPSSIQISASACAAKTPANSKKISAASKSSPTSAAPSP